MRLACSYFGNRMVRYVREDMQTLHRLGFDRVVHTFSENDLAYYAGTLREIVAVTREAGLEAWLDPWGVARIFGGEAFSRWTLQEEDLRQRGPSGRRFDGACLNHPRLRERMTEWISAAAATGATGIFWDEPHWTPRGPGNPGGEYCVCEHCLQRSGDLPQLPAEERERFRAESVVRLLQDLVDLATQSRLASSICVLPQGMTDQPRLPWDRIAALPGLAEFGTDPYWEAFGKTTPEERDAFIDQSAGAARDAARAAGVASMLWVQAFRIPHTGEEDLLTGVRRLASHRPDTIAVWSFEACAQMSSLSCERPEVVWRALVDLLGELAQQDT
ncbi:MAG: hypothetical protein GF330_09065 [Candidatus Eisenbacteria bacterium]|nr:hypothetical protein [Candidatus Eisenbacteria bacterium]